MFFKESERGFTSLFRDRGLVQLFSDRKILCLQTGFFTSPSLTLLLLISLFFLVGCTYPNSDFQDCYNKCEDIHLDPDYSSKVWGNYECLFNDKYICQFKPKPSLKEICFNKCVTNNFYNCKED